MITRTGSVYDVPLDQTVPPALSFDKRSVALTKVIAKQHQKNMRLIRDTVGIYYRIDELDERLLDILAGDLHVDWYSYDASLQVKRNLIQNSIKIHRLAGTNAGLRLVVECIHGECTIEEWFEYGGRPYYFRLGLNIADPEKEINVKRIVEAVIAYKPVRAHLEDEAVAFRSIHHLNLSLTWGYVMYSTPKCGTIPRQSEEGAEGETIIEASDSMTAATYQVPKAGQTTAGTKPVYTTRGAEGQGNVSTSAAISAGQYTSRKCGGTNYFC